MRPTPFLAEVRRLFRKPTADARQLKVLNPLPKDYQQRRGGLAPKRSLEGVYHGAMIKTGIRENTNNKDHTFYTTRRFKPNVKKLRHFSEVLNASFEMQTTTLALREIKKHGSFDNYLLNVHPSLLSTETTRIRDLVRTTLHAYLDLNRKLLPSSSPSSSSSSSTSISLYSEEIPEEETVLRLPAGIHSRPHALDKVRPEGLREGDRVMREERRRKEAMGGKEVVEVEEA